MKRNSKKLLALGLTVALCFTMVGCKKKTDDTVATDTATVESAEATTESTDTAESAEATVEEVSYDTHETISIALWGIGDGITDGDDAVRDIIYDKFNIDIEPFPVTWGDYTEKITLWAASQSLPDMTAYEAGFTTVYDDWTTQGVVRALPSDLSKYPNVATQVYGTYGKSVNKNYNDSADATYYAIPRPTYANADEAMMDYGIMLRKDWMQNVGVTEVPANLDDLITLLQKYQTEDPDGNGIDDTIGLTGYTYGWMTAVMSGTNSAGINGFRWVFDDSGAGTITPAWATADGLAGFKALKKVYDAGVLDPDYIIIKGEEGRDKFKNGIAGAYAHSGPSLYAAQVMEQQFAKTIPDKSIDEIITFTPLFANDEGKVEYVTDNLCWSETYLGAGVSDEKAERCLALMDYLLSDEGYRLVSLGIEGVDYSTDADGVITLIDTLKDDGTLKTQAEKYPIQVLGSLANWSGYRSYSSPAFSTTLKKMYDDYIAEQKANGAAPVVKPDMNGVIAVETADFTSAPGDYSQVCNDLMTSDDIDAAFAAYVDKVMNKDGFAKVVTEMNALYQAKISGK